LIDKLELRLPAMTLFHRRVREFILESRNCDYSSRVIPSKRYEWVTGLQPIGIEALLHYSLKRRENEPHRGEHKLELLDTGKKHYSAIVEQIEMVIEGPIDDLDIMRIDLCADVHGTPMEWFLQRGRVKFKRIAHEIGQMKYQCIGKAGIQTLSAGKRPNMVRIYNKVDEYKEQLRKMHRKRSADAEDLTLESEFGVSENDVITRVERQFGGQRIPGVIDSFGKLSSLPTFDPFNNIEIRNGSGAKVPNIEECGLDMWLTGMRLREMRDEMGEQQFRRFLSKHSAGNQSRYQKRYADFLEPDGDNLLTSGTLFETYRDSVVKQLSA
jgi:hypothetical protein